MALCWTEFRNKKRWLKLENDCLIMTVEKWAKTETQDPFYGDEVKVMVE